MESLKTQNQGRGGCDFSCPDVPQIRLSRKVSELAFGGAFVSTRTFNARTM